MAGRFPVAEFGRLRTPFYYYDTELLGRTLDAVSAELRRHPVFVLHYAVKANNNARILPLIAERGFGADCVSGGEIRDALTAGFPSSGIVFAGVGKSDWEIELALENDILCFNVESIPELEVIDSIAGRMGRRARVAFRIDPDVGAHTHAKITTGLAENKFGIAMGDLERVFTVSSGLRNVEVVGLHFHIGSQILDMGDFAALCNRINELQDRLERRGLVVGSVNVGGGLGVDYLHPNRVPIPDFRSYFDTYARFLRLRPGQTVHFELGRALVAQMGSLIARTLYVKQGTAKQFAIVDAGMSDLIRPALYQAYHKIENLSSARPEEVYDVVGPICESSDVFGKAVPLPGVRRGDFLAIRSAGAYGETMASRYNSRPLPASYLSSELPSEP